MSKFVNFRWPQGEDLNIQLNYKEGPTGQRPKTIPLASGYSLRMDLVNPDTKAVIYSFLSEEHPLTLTDGTNKANINIFLPRALTLTGGAILSSGLTNLSYDIFLRNTVTNKQLKILRGSITLETSNTLWP